MSDDTIKRLRDAFSKRSWKSLVIEEADIVALLDRLDAAERDCERYRWLRGDSCPDHSIRWTGWDVRCWVAPFWSDDLRRERLDRSIDAAMAADQPSDRREK